MIKVLNSLNNAAGLFQKTQNDKNKRLTYFMADISSAGKLLLAGSVSTTLFSTFCLQKTKYSRNSRTHNISHKHK